MMIATRPAAILLLACAMTACSGSGSTSGGSASPPATSPPAHTVTPAAPPATSVDPKRPLSDTEILWLTHFDRTSKQVTDQLSAGPRSIDTPAKMHQVAEGLRLCGRALAATTKPTQRLMPVYDLFATACQHFDRSATCADTAAELMKTPVGAGSAEDRKLSETIDCHSAEVTQGSTVLSDAQSRSYDIRSAAGDL
ncbi:MAG TPA: hypothetical protein VFP72_01050 [Kineosporiaceae bacterium]|nr:hypothetical protein [Kineosporiaceae bacterium]